MKNIILILPFLICFISCKQNEKENSPKVQVEEQKKPVVYVSNYPLQYFASEIAGEEIDLRFPASGETDPSGWVPGAEIILEMQEADLILLNGATFEKWLNNVSLPDDIQVNTTESIVDNILPLGEQFTHSHGEGGEHTHEGTASITWLDLSIAIAQAEKVNTALKEIVPDKSEEFQAKFNELKKQLSELDRNFKNLQIDLKKYQLIYSHPVYQYLQNAYSLQGESMHWEPSDAMSKNKKNEIERLVKKSQKTYLIWEEEPTQEMRRALEEMGITSIVVNPLFGQPENSDFSKVTLKNFQNLQKITK